MATPFAHSAAQISAAPASAVNSCLSELSRPGSAGNCTTRPGQGGPPQKAHTYAGVGGRFHSGHKATLHLHKCSHSLVGHLLAMWSWSRSWEKPTAVSEDASTASVCSALLPGHGLAQHGRLKHGPAPPRHTGWSPLWLGKAQGQHLQLCLHQTPRTPASPHHPPSASVDSFIRRSWELTGCGIGAQGMEHRLQGPLLGLISPLS